MSTTHTNDIWQAARDLSHAIHRLSWHDKDKPLADYPYVVGYMEAVLRNLPLSEENYKYLVNETKSIEKYIADKG